ncbi:hypothetical protein ACJX0J_030018, partial [Zea mays]
GPEVRQELILLLRYLKQCMYFSKKPYNVFLDYGGYGQNDVLIKKSKARILKPAFTIVCDRSSQCFLLFIRGAISVKERLTAATGAEVPFHHVVVQEGRVSNLVLGYAHCGMVVAARWIAKQAIPCLSKAIEQFPEYEVKGDLFYLTIVEAPILGNSKVCYKGAVCYCSAARFVTAPQLDLLVSSKHGAGNKSEKDNSTLLDKAGNAPVVKEQSIDAHASKSRAQNGKTMLNNGGSLANMWGRASAKPKPPSTTNSTAVESVAARVSSGAATANMQQTGRWRQCYTGGGGGGAVQAVARRRGYGYEPENNE